MTTSEAGNEMLPVIAPLPREVIERIAAGEVIERPVSVVRELLDNALDAGATSIRVELREGGLRLIRVADDGVGIAADALELACQRHTTSKLHTPADLESIATLGFRGEALASIATVAELELVSAATAMGTARTLLLRGGQPVAAGAIPRTRGTTVTVRALFAEMPARRALLRGARSEGARIAAVVRAYALLHPAVRFTLTGDGLLLLQTPGSDLAGAVAAIYGADSARALVPLGLRRLEGAELHGAVAMRAVHFPSREHVLVAVNGRPIANAALLAAAEAGYRPLLRKGRHPLLVAHLAVEPRLLDANVHPAKAVVLLRHEPALAAVLRESIHAALGSIPASLDPQRDGGAARPEAAHFSRAVQLQLPAARGRRGVRIREPGRRYASLSSGAPDEPRPGAPLPRLTALAQLDSALLVATSAEGHLYLVDQHRAHERALYEELRRRRGVWGAARATPAVTSDDDDADIPLPPAQYVLEPLLIELSPLQAQLLLPRLMELRALGMEFQPFGGSVFLVRALPDLPGAAQGAASFAEALVAEAAEDADDWLDHVCIALACRSAVRRGQVLSLGEQQALLDDLHEQATPAVCPHGSPLVLRHTHGSLVRAFEW